MSRVGILTFLHNQNYGSTLQAYALQRVIREMGVECEHIDYQPGKIEKIRNLLRSGNHPKLIIEGIRKRNVQQNFAGARGKSQRIPAFYAEHMQLSSVCRNGRQLKALAGKYETLLCGSDQIWNPVWLNPVYFLDFAAPGQRKLAYAASLGVKELQDRRKIRKIRRLLEGFEAVSVREEEGAALLQQITDRNVAVMPDPVCLLPPEEWALLARPPKISGKYLLCYFIGENPSYWARTQKLAEETGLPVKVLPVTQQGYLSGFDLVDGAGPEEFLGAIQQADLLVTDSFHGLVFGAIFGIQVELLRRDREDDPENKNSRVDQFLRHTEKQSLEELRRKGLDWLKTFLAE